MTTTQRPLTSSWLKRAALFMVPATFIAFLGWVMVQRTTRVVIGQPPPAIELSSFDGQEVRLADLAGKPVIINFWASWCLPCRQEAPDLASIGERYAGKVHLLGVNSRDLDENARKYVSEFGLDGWIHLRDPDAAVAGRYSVPRYPETFFIDDKGILVDHWIGPIGFRDLEARIELLIGGRG